MKHKDRNYLPIWRSFYALRKKNEQSDTLGWHRLPTCCCCHDNASPAARGDNLPIRYTVLPLCMVMNKATKCLPRGYAKLMILWKHYASMGHAILRHVPRDLIHAAAILLQIENNRKSIRNHKTGVWGKNYTACLERASRGAETWGRSQPYIAVQWSSSEVPGSSTQMMGYLMMTLRMYASLPPRPRTPSDHGV
jgi:hypothetical protein